MGKDTLAKIVTAAAGLAAALITLGFGIKAYQKYNPTQQKEETYFYYLDPNIDYNISTDNNDPRVLRIMREADKISRQRYK